MITRNNLFCTCFSWVFFVFICNTQLSNGQVTEEQRKVVTEFEKALAEVKDSGSAVRARLAIRRVIRDAEAALEKQNGLGKFVVLEFLFRAYQKLIVVDNDSKYRKALMAVGEQLMKAPNEVAELRVDADLLLSQAALARKGANSEERAKALGPFVARYVDTPAGPRVLRMGISMALELGDSKLVADFRGLISKRFAGDLEMINFQRDKLGGQVLGAPFVGSFERSDGKMMHFPLDGLGRSSMLLFWSKDEGGLERIKALAAAAEEEKDRITGRLELVSFNLDELEDGGASLLGDIAKNFKVLKLPGGKENPIFKAYARIEPRNLIVTPTGQTALVMAGTSRKKVTSTGAPDFSRLFGSVLARKWTEERYTAHISSLLAGDFFILDPSGGIDPSRPPEWKAHAKNAELPPLVRDENSVPAEVLKDIQASFIAPPLRYRIPHDQVIKSYQSAVAKCRRAISDYPNANDLWIVKNRYIVASLGLWKAESNQAYFDSAVRMAQTALEVGYPQGCDVVPRYCIALDALRNSDTKPSEVIGKLSELVTNGSESGHVLAATAILSLNVADRHGFEAAREAILKKHTEYPMMWTFSSFLLDRSMDYWMFQMPFTAGWSYGRRESYFQTKGYAEEAERYLKTSFQTLEGKEVRIPQDLDADWTIFVIARTGPWGKGRESDKPASPAGLMRYYGPAMESRPEGELAVKILMLDGESEEIMSSFGEKGAPCPVLKLPGGIENPLIHRLGILSDDTKLNSFLIRKDGRIGGVVSGMSISSGRNGSTLLNILAGEDERAIMAMVEAGKLEEAKERVLTLVPIFDPNAVDSRGRKLRKPRYHLYHIRARARVFQALKEWDQALADAEEVLSKQLGQDGGMSLRTDELDEAEAMLEEIKAKR